MYNKRQTFFVKKPFFNISMAKLLLFSYSTTFFFTFSTFTLTGIKEWKNEGIT